MRVVLDGRGILNRVDGIGRYSLNLIRELARLADGVTFDVLIRANLKAELRELFPRSVKLREIPYRHVSLRTLFSLGKIVDDLRADLYHSMFMFQPLFMRTPSILTIHDTMWFQRPRLQSAGKPLHLIAGYLYHEVFVSLSVRRSLMIFVPTEATRQDVLEYWPRLNKPVKVTGEGVDECFTPEDNLEETWKKVARLGVNRGPFLLHMTNGRPYKNTVSLIRSFAQVARDETVDLVIIGRLSAFSNKLVTEIKNLDLGNRLRFIGSVSNEDAVALMQVATSLVFPSLFEGFGLPVVEAMACGCPVITSDRGALAEIAGDACLLVDPTSMDSMADGMRNVISNETLRQQLRQAGLLRATRYDWPSVAKGILDIYSDLEH